MALVEFYRQHGIEGDRVTSRGLEGNEIGALQPGQDPEVGTGRTDASKSLPEVTRTG